MIHNQSNTRYYSADQSIRFEMWTQEEEARIFNEGKAGNEEARNKFIHNHLLFAMMEAGRKSEGRLPRDEMTSAANFAVMKAMQRFDPSLGWRFTTYLRRFIEGEIAALWKSKFSCKNVADPSIGGHYAGVSGPSNSCALQKSGTDTDGYSSNRDAFKEMTENNDNLSVDHEGEELDLQSYNREHLAAVLEELKPEERELLHKVYFQDIGTHVIAEEHGVTRQAANVALQRLLKRLHKSLKSKIEEVL